MSALWHSLSHVADGMCMCSAHTLGGGSTLTFAQVGEGSKSNFVGIKKQHIPEDQKGFLGVKQFSLRFPTKFQTQRISAFTVSGTDFAAGAALSQISRQAQHFRKVRCRVCGRRKTFARSGTDFAAGAGPALLQGQVQISQQAQHFRKVRCRFRGRHSTFARSGTDFAASAALSQVKHRFRGRRNTFARSGTEFVAGAALSQGQVGAALSQGAVQISRQAQHFCNFAAGAALSQGAVQISRQAQHFRQVRCRVCGRRSTFAREEEKDTKT